MPYHGRPKKRNGSLACEAFFYCTQACNQDEISLDQLVADKRKSTLARAEKNSGFGKHV
jgi:hypothetical protein